MESSVPSVRGISIKYTLLGPAEINADRSWFAVPKETLTILS